MRYQGPRWCFDLPLPSLPGAHQIANSGIAIACLEQLPALEITRETIAQGLRHIDWPARLQRLTRGPLVEMLPDGWELWLDGGHNPGAGEVLAAAVSGWADRPLYLIVGMLNTKNVAGFLAPLAPHVGTLYAVTIPGEQNALLAHKIAAAARSVDLPAHEAPSAAIAVGAIVADPDAGPHPDLRLPPPRRRRPGRERLTSGTNREIRKGTRRVHWANLLGPNQHHGGDFTSSLCRRAVLHMIGRSHARGRGCASELKGDAAPKEQPPRKLSGKRTAGGRALWKAAAWFASPLTDGVSLGSALARAG